MTNLASRTALAFLAVFSTAGCALQGERAAGGCPVGETCSKQAPNGLFFLGTATSDSFGGGVGIIAKGGVQTITVLTDSDLNSPPFLQSFDASTSDVTVAAVGKVAPPNVLLSGKSDGTSSLRLLESGTDNLLDRLDIQVATIATVSLFPRELFLIAEETAPWAMLAGGTAPLVVRLEGKSGERLVDEKLKLKSDSAVTQEKWDLFGVTAPASNDASFTITAGNGSFDAKVAVVTKLDDIVSSAFLGLPPDGKLAVAQDQTLCFVGKSSGAWTVGAKWNFTGSSTMTLTPSTSSVNTNSCVSVKGTAAGPAKLTVEAVGFSKDFDLEFGKEMPRVLPAQARIMAPVAAPIAGERAGN